MTRMDYIRTSTRKGRAAVLILLAFSSTFAYAFQQPQTTTTSKPSGCSSPFLTRTASAPCPSWKLHAKGKGDGEDVSGPGMEDALRRLESLGSLDDETTARQDEGKDSRSGSPKGSSIISPTSSPPPAADSASPEQEAQMYAGMVKELENKGGDGVYSDVLADMGGSKPSKPCPELKITADETSALPEVDTEEFMNQALREALEETKGSVPKDSMAESILDDKEMMAEIEQIFERGNEKLMDSLEEIRQEQKALAEKSADTNAQSGLDRVNSDAVRLIVAEASMEKILAKVGEETSEVEKAVEDLRKAQREMNKDPIAKLRTGGILKQGSFIGFILFSFRSIYDSVLALNGDETHLAAALVQSIIAIACAAFFFLV